MPDQKFEPTRDEGLRHQIGLRLCTGDYEWLEAVAKRRGTTMGDIARQAIQFARAGTAEPSVEDRLAALERDSHPPVDFGKLFEDVNRRLDALEESDG